MRKLLAGITLATLGLSVFAQPAVARKPDKEPFHASFHYTDHECGFGVRVYEALDGTTTSFFDRDGKLVRSRTHITYHGTWTNKDSGTWLAEVETFNNTYIRATHTYRVLGLNWHFKLASGRTVAIDAGRLIYDRHFNLLFEAGNHQIVDDGLEALCRYLS